MADIQIFRLGSVGQDSVNNTKVAAAAPTDTSRYMTLEFPVGTDFQVTAGYTLYITRVIVTGVANVTAIIGYGDDGVADGAAAPTNAVRLTSTLGGTTTNAGIYDVLIPIPAGKYPFAFSNNGAIYVTLFGVEIAD